MKPRWSARDVPSQHGRVAVVTGGTSGIGRVVALELARAGATVVLGVRDEARGAAAAGDVRAAAPGSCVIVADLDLASLTSVRRFAARMRGELSLIHI